MEQRNRRLFKIIIVIIELILLLLAILYCIDSKKQYNALLIANENLSEEALKNYDYTDFENEIQYYKNIDDEIANKKDEYYSNIALLEQKVINGETDIKIAYLTFDDGPYNLTQTVLDILKDNDIRATFFVLGKSGYEDTYKRIVNEGHTLGNHTYYHNIFKGLYSSADSFMEQVNLLEDYLYNMTGYKTTLVRFPGGSSTAGKLKNEIVDRLHSQGYNYVNWNSETGDGSNKKLQQMDTFEWYKETTKDRKIVVLLMHDYNQSTVGNLQNIIDDLKERNFIFLPLHNKSAMVY